MKYFIALAALCVPFAASAASWTSEIQDGLKIASVKNGETSLIEVTCDVGINAPVTAITFVLGDRLPIANSTVRLTFDDEKPIFVNVDNEGGIGSLTPEAAQDFENILAKMKAKSSVKVRIFDGSEDKFALRGSSKALGECEPDFARYN